ncbi:LysR family transcriptional regulator [Sphingomonas bacterium]|uniref:LysR family transcriptional regulator n=1 Tax=Sphingomonas bacterium TaxID=1895847 RepID=UPI0015776820|nr:LysR family transcriptional regulator [Sphingomonas bacterium]
MSKHREVLEPSAIFARNIDWNLFKVFYEIARRGSITSAANALNRTQPSISAALQRLEGYVGSPLCARTSKGVLLTVHGEHLYSACQHIYEVVQSTSREASILRGDVSGVVTLRVIASLYLQPRLTEMIESFHALYPRIEIKLDVAPWRQILQSLQNGEVELAIGFDPNPGDGRTHILLSEQTQQLYCGPAHRLFGKRVASPSELRDEPFVITHDEPTPYVEFREKYGIGRPTGGYADGLYERMWLIEIGMGIGFLPQPVVEASPFRDKLSPLLSENVALKWNVYLMARSQSARSAPAQLLFETAEAYFAGSAADEPHSVATSVG